MLGAMRADRRHFLSSATAGALLVGCGGARSTASPQADQEHRDGEEGEEEVTPAEDLMREHGVLRRVMYLYDEAALRFDAGRDVPLDALAAGAAIIERVIHDYHEQSEEHFVFPRFEQAGKLADLTAVLRRQHLAGRAVTSQVVTLAKVPLAAADRATLSGALRRFNHMYRAHAGREDTVLFPLIREVVGAAAYAELGEQLEAEERRAVGDHGFEHAVTEVAALERAFGVDDLATLTA